MAASGLRPQGKICYVGRHIIRSSMLYSVLIGILFELSRVGVVLVGSCNVYLLCSIDFTIFYVKFSFIAK